MAVVRSDELVQVTNFAHGWLFDIFDAYAADDALDQRSQRIELWRLIEKGFEVRFVLE